MTQRTLRINPSFLEADRARELLREAPNGNWGHSRHESPGSEIRGR